MKLSKSQLEKIIDFAKENIEKNDCWHNLFHTSETVRISQYLAKEEKADVKKCVIAAWLHDIAKRKHNKKTNHGDEGAKISRIFLREIGIKKSDIQDICYVISKHNKGGYKSTKEAKVVYDADKLQSTGIYGLLRDYGFMISAGTNQEDSYKVYLRESKFYSERLYTKTAKNIIKAQIPIMKKFNDEYNKLRRLK